MSHPANDPPPMPYEEEAADWCWRIAEGALAPEDQQAFDAWLTADPRHRDTFEDMVTVWQGTDAIAEMPGFLSLRAKALTTMEHARDEDAPQKRRIGPWYAGMAAAAAILLMVISGTWWLAAGPDIYQTGVGERQVVRLEDGSRVSLDASSRVLVAYSSDRRALTLERGRAKFDVAKDPLRPFTVTAGQKTVVATGTAFSVELLGDQVRVFLYEGHVSVLSRPNVDEPAVPVRLARRNVPAEQSLKPGAELVADMGSASAVVAPADVERSLSWEAGRLSFTDEPLSSAVERVNRYTDTPVVIGDAAAGRHIINGVFDAGDTGSFVSGVVSLYPISVRREGNQITLVSKPPSAP
jgi:transmembrane sensor